ncbi:MAG TPA: hypothetical protein VM093_07940 [Aeromicrobium sp.]|nr:hypothetical protein [Aeromicrobium sp.]
MRGHPGATVALALAGLLLSGCAGGQQREWKVAADPHAAAEDIIDAGHATGIATSPRQMVVTWEVEPEDDEGPYQGAWRLYDRDKGAVADGSFGTVREASARIEVMALRDGFLLTDYKKHALHFLSQGGKLSPAYLPEAKRGTPLAGGMLMQSQSPGPLTWQVVLPDKRQVVPLTDLPTKDVQGIELTSDGTVWVLLPWKQGGPFRIAHARDGKAPWTTETVPLPKGSGTSGEGISAVGDRLFVVATHAKGERMPVDVILAREADEDDWEKIDATGIADDLTVEPRIAVLHKGRLAAIANGEGAWVERPDGDGWIPLKLPKAAKTAQTGVSFEGKWLWASQELSGNSLHYSFDGGNSWREFER